MALASNIRLVPVTGNPGTMPNCPSSLSPSPPGSDAASPATVVFWEPTWPPEHKNNLRSAKGPRHLLLPSCLLFFSRFETETPPISGLTTPALVTARVLVLMMANVHQHPHLRPRKTADADRSHHLVCTSREARKRPQKAALETIMHHPPHDRAEGVPLQGSPLPLWKQHPLSVPTTRCRPPAGLRRSPGGGCLLIKRRNKEHWQNARKRGAPLMSRTW